MKSIPSFFAGTAGEIPPVPWPFTFMSIMLDIQSDEVLKYSPMTDPITWNDPTTPPESHLSVRILLSDGSTTSAIWTGQLWWGRGKEQSPVGWLPFERAGYLVYHPEAE